MKTELLTFTKLLCVASEFHLQGVRREHVLLTVHVETEALSFSEGAPQARLPFSHSVTAV